MNAFKENFQKWDKSLCLRIYNLKGKKFLNHFMALASRFGNGYFYPFVALILSAFDTSMFRQLFSTGLASFVVEHSTYALVKSKTRRLRPSEVIPSILNRVQLPDRFSFPSGHAAGAFLMATLLSHYYSGMGIPLYATASVISVSRIYNGVHYPSDVMAGTVLGIISARIGLFIAA